METTNKIINALNTVSSDLHDLTLRAVFSKQFLNNERINIIGNIKSNIFQLSNDLDTVHAVGNETTKILDTVVNECMSSLHEINLNMKQDLISQNAEDEFAELSARVFILHEQVERIKNS